MNRGTCPREFHKDCNISKYLKDYECMKSIAVDLVVTCEEIVDTIESTTTNLVNKMFYWLIAVVLFVNAYLLFLGVMVVEQYCEVMVVK